MSFPRSRGSNIRCSRGDEVSATEGTGIVHTATGAGKEDFALGREHGLPVIAPLNDVGEFVEGFDWLTGMSVAEVNEPIYDSLKRKGGVLPPRTLLAPLPGLLEMWGRSWSSGSWTSGSSAWTRSATC